MCSRIDSGRLQIGIHSVTTFSRKKEDNGSYPAKGFSSKELDTLSNKNAIEKVQKGYNESFLQYTFSGTKETRGMRPVINMRPRNRYLVKKQFQLDIKTKVLQLVEQED